MRLDKGFLWGRIVFEFFIELWLPLVEANQVDFLRGEPVHHQPLIVADRVLRPHDQAPKPVFLVALEHPFVGFLPEDIASLELPSHHTLTMPIVVHPFTTVVGAVFALIDAFAITLSVGNGARV